MTELFCSTESVFLIVISNGLKAGEIFFGFPGANSLNLD